MKIEDVGIFGQVILKHLHVERASRTLARRSVQDRPIRIRRFEPKIGRLHGRRIGPDGTMPETNVWLVPEFPSVHSRAEGLAGVAAEPIYLKKILGRSTIVAHV